MSKALKKAINIRAPCKQNKSQKRINFGSQEKQAIGCSSAEK